MTRIALLAFVVIVALPACGGEDDPARTPAGMAQVELMEDLYNGRLAGPMPTSTLASGDRLPVDVR